MRTVACLCLFVLTATGCTLANLTPQARFAESTHVLNDATRWGRVDMAVEQVSPKYLSRFMTRHREWGHAISIADFDVVRMQVAADRKTATSEVTISWYPSDGVMLRTSTIVQQWEAEHGGFRLVDEAVEGDPRVFVKDEDEEG
jgi:hypothetical protein